MSTQLRSKLNRFMLIIFSFITIVSYQNCGKSFQTAADLNQVVNQASSLSGLPPVNTLNGEVDLAWDRTSLNEDNTPASIRGYKIYIGNSSGNYSTTISDSVVGNFTDHRITGLSSGQTYYFAVAAVSNNGLESNRSSEIAYTAP